MWERGEWCEKEGDLPKVWRTGMSMGGYPMGRYRATWMDPTIEVIHIYPCPCTLLYRWIQDQMQEELQQRVYSSSTVTTMLPGQGKLPGSSLLPKGAAANNRKAAVAAGLRAVAARRSSSGGAAGPAGGFYGGAAGGPLGLRGGGGSGSGSGGVFGGAGGSFLDQMRSEASAVGMRLVTQVWGSR